MLATPRDAETFERFKLLKFWLQSFLAGVPTVVVGFRDDGGVVRELKVLETMSLPRIVRPKGWWDPTACINFGKAVLEWLQEEAKRLPSGTRAVLRYEPAQRALLLLADDGGTADDDGAPEAKRRRV